MRKLYVFVEGNDDELFFKTVIVPVLKSKYNDIEIIDEGGVPCLHTCFLI